VNATIHTAVQQLAQIHAVYAHRMHFNTENEKFTKENGP